jgi:opacity protein-like surface antigen
MRVASLTALVALVAATAAQAQVPDRAVGLGVSLNPSAIIVDGSEGTLMLPVGFGNIHIPIIAGPHLKIEPEFGIWRTSSSYSGTGTSSSSTSTLLRVGAGVFRFVRVGGGTALYVGPRVAMVRTSSSSTYSGGTPSSSHQTNWSFGLAIGGEHFFSPHFSLGGEVQLNYIKLGTEEHEPSTPSTSSYSSHMISNNGLVFIRLYR